MVWTYLIVQSIGLGILAWSYKAENKDTYATPLSIGGLLSLLLAVVMAPTPIKLLMCLLIVLAGPKVYSTFPISRAAIVSCFRTSSRLLALLGSSSFNFASWSILKLLPKLVNHSGFQQWQAPQASSTKRPDNDTIIDVEAVEVSG